MTVYPSPRPAPVAVAVTPQLQPRSHPVRLATVLVLALVSALLLVCAAQLFWAQRHLASGANDITSVIDVVKSPAALENPVLRQEAFHRLTAARREFARAKDDLTIARSAHIVSTSLPVLGPALHAAPYVANAAYDADSSALELIRGGQNLWPLLDRHVHGHSLLPALSAALSPGKARFLHAARLAARADRELRQADLGRSGLGLSRVKSAAQTLRATLPRIHAAGLWLATMPAVLGEHLPTSYLFVWENSKEIRPAGGFIGADDLVTMTNGNMRKRFSGSELDHEAQFRSLPIQEAALTNEGEWLFRDSNVSPDFPTSARLERWFYGRDTGHWPSGIIDFVDQGIPDILSATGRVFLPQYHVWVTQKNALALADRYAGIHAAQRGPQGPGANLDTYRKQFLGFEFSAITKKLLNLPVSKWGSLATALAYAIQRHDILIYDTRPEVRRAIAASGASGALHPSQGDYLGIVDDNRSYNKISPYIRETADYHVQVLPSGWLDSSVSVTYHLGASPPSIEGVGPRFGHAGSKHDFLDFVRVLVPNGSVVQSRAGVELVTSTPAQEAYGLTQLDGYFVMSPHSSHTIVFHYVVPPPHSFGSAVPHYSLSVPRQPGGMLSSVHVRLTGVGRVRLRRGFGRPRRSESVDLGTYRDQTVRFRVLGLGTVSPLPETSWVPDPLVPWSALERAHPPLRPKLG